MDDIARGFPKSFSGHLDWAKTAPRPGRSAQPTTEPLSYDPKKLTSAQQARLVRDCVLPGLMSLAISPKGQIEGLVAKGYRDELHREMGDPTDPLERMLIEQAAVGNVMVMQLHALAAQSGNAVEAGIFVAAAARLMAELRRMILAVRQYRTPLSPPHVTRIEQQNVADRQEVHYVASNEDGSVTMACRDKNEPDTKLGSNRGLSDDESDSKEIDSPCGRRTTEPATAGTALG